MRYFELTGLRALYQTVCFAFIGAVALGSHIFGYPTSEIRDTGGINKSTITSVKDTTDQTDTPDIAQSFKTTSGSTYSAPVTTASASVSGPKTLYFNQSITPKSKVGNTYCTEYDAGAGIIHCMDYGAKFYYAHRAGAFAQLPSAERGDYIVLGGQTYKVKKAVSLSYSEVQARMDEVVGAGGHNISLMTCYGANDSQRFIVYAD